MCVSRGTVVHHLYSVPPSYDLAGEGIHLGVRKESCGVGLIQLRWETKHLFVPYRTS